jgi:hypothetical protein
VSPRTEEGAIEASTGLGPATLAAIGRGVGTRQRRWLVAITLLERRRCGAVESTEAGRWSGAGVSTRESGRRLTAADGRGHDGM